MPSSSSCPDASALALYRLASCRSHRVHPWSYTVCFADDSVRFFAPGESDLGPDEDRADELVSRDVAKRREERREALERLDALVMRERRWNPVCQETRLAKMKASKASGPFQYTTESLLAIGAQEQQRERRRADIWRELRGIHRRVRRDRAWRREIPNGPEAELVMYQANVAFHNALLDPSSLSDAVAALEAARRFERVLDASPVFETPPPPLNRFGKHGRNRNGSGRSSRPAAGAAILYTCGAPRRRCLPRRKSTFKSTA